MNIYRLTYYSIAHFLVDAACIYLILGGINAEGEMLKFILISFGFNSPLLAAFFLPCAVGF
jgi:hypothetical protein